VRRSDEGGRSWPLFGCCIILNFLKGFFVRHLSTLFLCFYLFQLSFFLAYLNLVGDHAPLTKKKKKKKQKSLLQNSRGRVMKEFNRLKYACSIRSRLIISPVQLIITVNPAHRYTILRVAVSLPR